MNSTDSTDLTNSADSTDLADSADTTDSADSADSMDLADLYFNPHLDCLTYFKSVGYYHCYWW